MIHLLISLIFSSAYNLQEGKVMFYNEIGEVVKPLFHYESKTIRVIPQGTVDNNLGPYRLAGPKALDPNYCRLPTL